MKTQRILGLFIGVIMLMMTVVAFAADDSWVVIKDKDNVCKVVKAQEKIANTIAGPFTGKEEAEQALAKACPKSTIEKLREKAAEGIEKAKAEAEKLKEKAAPSIEKAKGEAEKLKEKAEEGIDKAREMIKDHLPKK
jgi:F0F1-type ATP synthase membrane subunit b/b'